MGHCFIVQVNDWDATNPTEGAGIVAATGRNTVRTFFERITKDIEIVRVALLLTGCIQVGVISNEQKKSPLIVPKNSQNRYIEIGIDKFCGQEQKSMSPLVTIIRDFSFWKHDLTQFKIQ